MLMPLPAILLDVVHIDRGQWILAEDATEEQKKAFEKFIKVFKKEKEKMIVDEQPG